MCADAASDSEPRVPMKKTEKSGDDDIPMSPEKFRAWRRTLGWKQKDAADALGLKKRMIQYYEKGKRDGKKVTIPKSVRLACYALSKGVTDFDGELVVAVAPGGDLEAHSGPLEPELAADGQKADGVAVETLLDAGKNDG